MSRIVAAALVLFALAVQPALTVPVVTVVMSGLDNPRGLAFGPEGALYVAEAGRKTLIDIAFAQDGTMYLLQHATGPMFFAGPGQIIRIAPGGGTPEVVYDGLTRPTSLAIGPDGALYVSNLGASVGTGQVLRIEL